MAIPENLTRYLALAQRLLARGRLPSLLLAVSRKMRLQQGQVGRLRGDIGLLLGLCLAWWRGEYRALGSQALLSIVAGLLYFLIPLDAVPDWLPGVGLLDDLAVLAWVLRTWDAELQAYRVWREQRGEQALAQIERLPGKEEMGSR
ncbi:MAG: YkvA family protein [Pseudomonas sp.]